MTLCVGEARAKGRVQFQTTSMKNNKFLTTALLCLSQFALLTPAQAIKITVPDQYKDQVEAIKQAERKEREQELEGVAESAEGGIQIAGEDKPEPEKPAVDADEFLVQSVIEATDTAAAMEASLSADHGLISGQVVDKETGAPVVGAAIILEGTDIGTITDDLGRYSIGPAPAGTYTLSFIKSGYIEANVTDFAVKSDEVSVFPFALPPRPAEMSDEVYELQDFTVTAEEANDLMMKLELTMNSNSILSVMSAEDFSKYAASDIGDAIKRVSGVSVVGGKYAVIRGLGDRYVWTTMNGLPIASPDPDKLAVQLDLFPSSLFESIEVLKTFTPDQSGTATGALNLRLKDLPDEFFMDVSTSIGYHSIATGNDKFLTNDRGNSRDQFAMGTDGRSLSGFATEFPENLNKQIWPLAGPVPERFQNFFTTRAEQEAAAGEADAITTRLGRNFHNFGKAPGPDYGVKFSAGDSYELNDQVKWGYVGGLNYSRKFRMIEDADYFRSASELSAADTLSPEVFVDPERAVGYRNQSLTESTATSVLSWLVGFGLEIKEDHKFNISRLDLRQSEDENTRLYGDIYQRFPISEDGDTLDTQIAESLKYTERRLTSDQISGRHRFDLAKDFLFEELELDWALGRDRASQNEPGFVQVDALLLDDGNFSLRPDGNAPPGEISPTFVIWREIEEKRDNGRFDIRFNGPVVGDLSSAIKFGMLKST